MTGLEDIRRAAVVLFAERGYAATGIRDIGRAVGLNSATLYHYVGGKEELLTGVMRASLGELLRTGREAVGHSVDPAVRLARLVRAHVAMEAVNPLTSRVCDSEVRSLTGPQRAVIIGLRDDSESLFRRTLEDGLRTGHFVLGDLRVARYALLEMCNGVANWYRPDGRLTVVELADRFSELACRMTGCRVVRRDECAPHVEIRRLGFEPANRAGISEIPA